jgi:hypothetical protein
MWKDFRQILKIEEKTYQHRAEEDEELSYIVIAGNRKIIASTKAFRRIFHYDNPEKPLYKRPYSKVLRIPEHAPDYTDIKKLFRNPEKREFQTSIIDGDEKERFVHIIKYKPHIIDPFKNKTSDNSQESRPLFYFYTRVDVLQIGTIEGELRKLHLKKPIKNLTDLLEIQAAKKVKEEAEVDRKS